MGLAIRIIPVLLQRGNSLVKGKGFNAWRSVGHVRQAFKIHATRGVDELIYINIGATPENTGPDYQLIESMVQDTFTPLTVGGGIKNKDDMLKAFNAGADKVCICTALFDNPQDITFAGAQAVVAAIDVKNNEVWSHCGTQPRNFDPVGFSQHCENSGIGEILLTSIERDGTLEGYDCNLIKKVSKAVNIPVIANGGCGSYEDMIKAIDSGAHSVAAGAFFQFTDATPKGAAHYLNARGYETRID